MSQFQDSIQPFEDAIELVDVLATLDALLPQGLSELPHEMIRAFERDDYSAALAKARDLYTKDGGEKSLIHGVVYAVLLQGRGPSTTQEAAGVLRKLMHTHQNDLVLQLVQVQNLMIQGNDEAALGLLEGLSSVAIFEPKWAGFMADLYLESDREDDAIRWYRRALELKSQDPNLAYRLSRLLLDQSQDHEAAHYMEQAARIAATDARLWMLAADAWSMNEDYARAADCWRRVVKMEETEEQNWLAYGSLLRDAEDLEGARKALERALRLDPLLHEAMIQLGHVLLEMGFAEESLSYYKQVLQDQPTHLEALQGAAASAFDLGDLLLAETYSRQAIDRDPERPEGHYNLGIVMSMRGKWPEAIDALEMAVKIEPQPGSLVALGTTYLRAQEPDKALEMLGMLVSLHHVGVQEATEALLEFVEALILRGMQAQAIQIVRQELMAKSQEAWWEPIGTLLDYLASATAEAESLPTIESRFQAQLQAHKADLPLFWDFDQIERLALSLPQEPRRRALTMIRQLED